MQGMQKSKLLFPPWALKDLSSHQAEDSPGAAGGCLLPLANDKLF